MFTIKELLQLVHDDIVTNGLNTSLCYHIGSMNNITPDEYRSIRKYFNSHTPLTFYYRFIDNGGYWFKPHRVKPRLRYLKKQIKKL